MYNNHIPCYARAFSSFETAALDAFDTLSRVIGAELTFINRITFEAALPICQCVLREAFQTGKKVLRVAIGAASVCARNALITVVSCDVARVALKTEEGKKRKKEEKVE